MAIIIDPVLDSSIFLFMNKVVNKFISKKVSLRMIIILSVECIVIFHSKTSFTDRGSVSPRYLSNHCLLFFPLDLMIN